MIVRESLADLPGLLADVGIERPYVIASPRWRALDVPAIGWWTDVPAEQVDVPSDADGILGVGGGSAIDTAKHASAETGLPVVHVPTTYSGAEWTTHFGIRSSDRRIRGGGGGAQPVGLVYDADLTLELPLDVTVGTSLNALAHCAEALYVSGRSAAGDEQALLGAALIAQWLPQVVAAPGDRGRRESLFRGAMHAGHALALAGLGLAHAMAQAAGGTYGLPHGAMNALCLPPGLVFNRELAPVALERFGAAIGGDAVERTRELALLGGFERLRDFGIPRDGLPQLAEIAAGRSGNQANPRPATAAEIERLFVSVW
jgi:maleylacetate reductase